MCQTILIVYAVGIPTLFFWLLRSNSILYHLDKSEHEERVAKEGKRREFGYDREWHYWRIKSPEWRRNVIWRRAIIWSIFWPIAVLFYAIGLAIVIFEKTRDFLVKLPE